jgi:hypothetical protein
MVASPNIWLHRLAVHAIDMVAPSINMVVPQVFAFGCIAYGCPSKNYGCTATIVMVAPFKQI